MPRTDVFPWLVASKVVDAAALRDIIRPGFRQPVPEPTSQTRATPQGPQEPGRDGLDRRDSPDHRGAPPSEPRQRSIHEPCLFHARPARPCWLSPAASPATSTRILDVLCVLYSPLCLLVKPHMGLCCALVEVKVPERVAPAARRGASPALHPRRAPRLRPLRLSDSTKSRDYVRQNGPPPHHSDIKFCAGGCRLDRLTSCCKIEGYTTRRVDRSCSGCSGLLQKGWASVVNDCVDELGVSDDHVHADESRTEA
jgi:hypothetical protein